MDNRIKYGRDMTTEEFEKLLVLDAKFFGDDILINEGMAVKRFLKFKDCIISMFSDDTPIGFVCFFNVDYSIYQRAFIGQEVFDDNLCDKDVLPMTKEHKNYILILDLIVDASYRNQGISKLLFGLMGDYLKQKRMEGYEIGSIFGYTISSKGHRHSSYYGGRDIWIREDITLVEMEKEVFIGTFR